MANEEQKWLDREFLSRCLQEEVNYGGNIDVTQFTSELVVPEGNNYGSCIRRVKLEFKRSNEPNTQSLSLIVKSPLQSGFQAYVLESIQYAECKFYSQFLPIAKQLSSSSFAPKCFYSPEPNVIVMEDLKEQGYVMKDRCLQLDYDHCRAYAIASATFHAVSTVAHNVNAELIESLGEEKLFSEELQSSKVYKILMQYGLECTIDFIEKTEFRKYTKLLKEANTYLFKQVIEAHKPSEVMNSLNQGDPWTPNMMFKYDEYGKVADIKLLDFQALRYGSPINDLVFFLWSSANHDVRESRMHDIFHLYCDTLNNKLKELKCSECLSYDDVLNAVNKLSPLMLFIVVAFIPLQVNPGSVDIADLVSGEADESGRVVNKYAKYFTQHFCDNFLLRYLKQLDQMGVFEYIETSAKLG